MMWHRHKWQLVRVETLNVNKWQGSMSAWFSYKETDLFYVCGRTNCEGTAIKRIDGHWTMEELNTKTPYEQKWG